MKPYTVRILNSLRVAPLGMPRDTLPLHDSASARLRQLVARRAATQAAREISPNVAIEAFLVFSSSFATIAVAAFPTWWITVLAPAPISLRVQILGAYLTGCGIAFIALWFLRDSARPSDIIAPPWQVWHEHGVVAGAANLILAFSMFLGTLTVSGALDNHKTLQILALSAMGYMYTVVGIALGTITLRLMYRRLIWPSIARRRTNALTSHELTAIYLIEAAAEIEQLAPWARSPSKRKRVGQALERGAVRIEGEVPYEAWAAGAGSDEMKLVRLRCRHGGAEIRKLARDIVHSSMAGSVDARVHLITLAAAVADGDWQAVMQADEPPQRDAITVAKKYIPAAVPVVAGLSLNAFPSFDGKSGAQIALITAGILSLIRVDQSTRDLVTGVYKDVGK